MFSRTAEYAVRAVLVLARHRGETLLSAEDISTALGAPANYMSKTLHLLVRRGVLNSTRGPHGGFALANSPYALTVADVVDVFADARVELKTCMLGNRACNPMQPCQAHECWMNITTSARAPLLQTTIAELAGIDRSQELTSAADHADADTTYAGRNPIQSGTES